MAFLLPSGFGLLTAIDLRTARQFALQVVLGQLGMTLLIAALCLLLWGSRPAYSALLGGGISATASLSMAVSFFRHGSGADPQKILRGVYAGEFAKLLLTALLFIVVIALFEVSVLALFGAYVATILVYWVALLRVLPSGSTSRNEWER